MFSRIVQMSMINDSGCPGIQAFETTSELAPEEVGGGMKGRGKFS
jgi:hypothetical protein